MHTTTRLAQLITACLFAIANASAATFTYHGNLQDAGKPAEGNYDLELTLYSAASGGSAIGGPLTMYAVPVHEGSFSTEADFGPLTKVQGDAWLAVQVRPAGSGAFAPLSERAPVSAATTAATSVCPGAWTLAGNAGNPVGSYLGTADAQPLIFKVNNLQAGQFTTDGNFSLRTNPINANVELNVGGSAGQGGYANLFMHQNNANDGILLSAGDATASDNNASFYLDDFNGTGQSRRLSILGNGAIGLNATTGLDGLALGGDDLTVGGARFVNQGFTSIALKTGNSSGVSLHANGPAIDGYPAYFAISYLDSGTLTYMLKADAGFGIGFNGGSPSSGHVLVVGTNGTNGNGAYLTPGGAWTNASSRTFKEAFAHIDAGAILDKLIALPISTWRYKNDAAEGTHLGPVAEDFKSAFDLGNDERHISTIDEEGVALAAIQGLNARLQAENANLRADLDQQKLRLDALERRIGADTTAGGSP